MRLNTTTSTAELTGRPVPDVSFPVLAGDGRLNYLRSGDVFRGKRVALFALPGAFTPTCSSTHVPRYRELAHELRARGVDRIVCLAVNDPYVMAAWARDQHADDILFLPDAAGEFTRRLGMLTDKQDAGLGQRSRRYSALVSDGVIEQAFVEPEASGDPFGVSDADTMLAYLDPHAAALEPALMFARSGCPHCARARAELDSHGIPYEEVSLGERVSLAAVRAATGRSTVPQIFMGGKLVGGADDLHDFLQAQQRRAAPGSRT